MKDEREHVEESSGRCTSVRQVGLPVYVVAYDATSVECQDVAGGAATYPYIARWCESTRRRDIARTTRRCHIPVQARDCAGADSIFGRQKAPHMLASS